MHKLLLLVWYSSMAEGELMRVFGRDLLLVLASSVLVWLPAQGGRSNAGESGQSLTVVGACAEQQEFQVDLQPDTGNGPHYVVKNLCAEPLTAFYLDTYSSADGKPNGGQLWDALFLQRSPIAKGKTTSQPLGHVVGQPFSGKIEITAAVWADGSTFGNPERLKLILSSRISDLQSYERAISVLQKGIQGDWTRDQYLAAWDQETKNAPMTGAAAAMMESNLRRNPSLDSPANVQRIMQHFLEMFIQSRDLLRQSKPELSAVRFSN